MALSRPIATPAGGSAAAIAAALGASLVVMAAGLTGKRKQLAGIHPKTERIRTQAEQLRADLLELASEDARVFATFRDALQLPAGTELERQARDAAKRGALTEGARVQLEVARGAAKVAELGEQVAAFTSAALTGDAATATFLAAAAVRSACWAARSDLGRETDDGRDLMNQAEAVERRVIALLKERMG